MSLKKELLENFKPRIKPCPLNFKKVENFIKRAKKDLSTAGLIETKDLEAAYQLLYDGMLHSALAHMVSDAVQPDVKGKHKTVVITLLMRLGSVMNPKCNFLTECEDGATSFFMSQDLINAQRKRLRMQRGLGRIYRIDL